jgi:hypothetical protein
MLGDDNKDIPFAVVIYDASNNILEQKIVNVPESVIDTWSDDSVITEYLLTATGIEAVNTDVLEEFIKQVNEYNLQLYSSTDSLLVYGKLSSYLTSIDSFIVDYRAGNATLNDMPTIESIDNTIDVKIHSNEFVTDLKTFLVNTSNNSEFVKQKKMEQFMLSLIVIPVEVPEEPETPEEEPAPEEPIVP